jgi:hypothetical protein
MSTTRKFTVLAGSERQPVRGARLIHASHPDQTIEVSIRLRHKSETKHRELKAALEKPGFQPMSRTEYENAHGADPADFNQIKKFAQEFGLKVHETGTSPASSVSTTAPRRNRTSGVCPRLRELKPMPPLAPTIPIKWRKSTTIPPETAPASASASSS